MISVVLAGKRISGRTLPVSLRASQNLSCAHGVKKVKDRLVIERPEPQISTGYDDVPGTVPGAKMIVDIFESEE